MTEVDSLSFMKQALTSLRLAVADELKKKAMLGQQAVVCINGKPCIVAAKTLVNQLREEIVQDFNNGVAMAQDVAANGVAMAQDVAANGVAMAQDVAAKGVAMAQDMAAKGVAMAQDVAAKGVAIAQDVAAKRASITKHGHSIVPSI